MLLLYLLLFPLYCIGYIKCRLTSIIFYWLFLAIKIHTQIQYDLVQCDLTEANLGLVQLGVCSEKSYFMQFQCSFCQCTFVVSCLTVLPSLILLNGGPQRNQQQCDLRPRLVQPDLVKTSVQCIECYISDKIHLVLFIKVIRFIYIA